MRENGVEMRVFTDCGVPDERNGSTISLLLSDAALPKLPSSHLAAHLPFRTACERFDRHARDWNGEFQQLWDEERLQVWCIDNRESFEEFLHKFESYCFTLVESLCMEGGSSSTWSSRALSFPDSFRVGNIMLRVWRDQKLGLNMQRCFRVLLDCKAPGITFPLSAAFRYYNVSITAQAVIPIPRSRGPIYRGDGVPDALLHRPLHDYISFLLESLNIIPHGVGTQSKHLGVEVYEGADLRLYILNPIGLLPPVINLPSVGRSVPLRRWWHIVRNPPAHFMQPPVQAYQRAVSKIQFVLLDALQEAGGRRFKSMVRGLHENGLNVCLLGEVARHLLSQMDDDDESKENLLRLISVEMIARAVRRLMYRQVALERAQPSVKIADTYLARAVGAMMDPEPGLFLYGLMPTICDMFPATKRKDDDNHVIDTLMENYLRASLRENLLLITRRLCALCGFVLNRGIVERIECVRSAHNYSSYVDVSHESAVSVFMLNTSLESDVTRGLLTSLLLPYHVVHHMRAGRVEQAMRLSRRIVAIRARTKQWFLYFEALLFAAPVAAHFGDHEAVRAMLDRAQSVIDITPAFEIGAIKKSGAAALPRNRSFLPGHINVAIGDGFLRCYCEDYTGARDCFLRALELGRTMDAANAEFAAQMILLPFAGLLETTTRSPVVTVAALLTLWSQLRQRCGPSLYGTTICQRLATLLHERNMYEEAAEQMRDALEIVVLLLGERSFEAGMLLNKLAFVYYTWNVKQFGVLCGCLLHFSETIMVETRGEFSVSHLCVVENIVVVLMMRGNFVVASRRLTAILQPSSRMLFRIPRDHPVTIRLYETQERLKMLFKPTAVVIIQHRWREYRRRLGLKSVFEVNAALLQRMGRGMMRRRLLLRYSRSRTNLDELHRRDLEFALLNFSKPLLRGSELLTKRHRNWNGEMQQYHQRDLIWDAASSAVRQKHFSVLEKDFHTTVLECIRTLKDSPHLLTPVPGCSTSYVMENVVFTRVAKDDDLPRMQNATSALLRHLPTPFLTASLTDYVETTDEAYLAQALIPVHHQPRIIIESDGKLGTGAGEAERNIVEEIFWLLHGHGSELGTGRVCGMEMIKAMDGMWYVTNGIGLLMCVRDRIDELPVLLSSSPYQRAVQLCALNQQTQAVTLMEQFILSRKWQHDANKCLAQAFLAYCRAAAGEVKGMTSKLFQTSAEVLEGMGWMQLAGTMQYLHGRALIRMGEYALAIDPLMEQFRKLKAGRLHSYYATYLLLDNALWLCMASRNAGKPLNRAVITFTLQATAHGEPTELLFEACAAMMQYCVDSGELHLAEEFAALRERKAKELDEASSLRYAKALLDHSQLLFKRGGQESYEASASLLTAAIRIVETAQPDSLILGMMLNNYGSVLTHLNKLPSAKKALLSARQLLQKYVGREQQEMICWWKNMKVLENRLQQGASLRIQRAVRRWLERRVVDRRLEQEDPERYSTLLHHRLQWRMKRLVVAEATARIFIAVDENEDFYALQSKQRQGLSSAKVATIHRETRGARVRIYETKVETSLLELIRFEEGIRYSLLCLQQNVQMTLITQGLWEQHRLGRRCIIRENHVLRIGHKLWRINNVTMTIRTEMLRAHLQLLLYLVIREEAARRKVIERENRQKKRALGVTIGRILKKGRHHSVRTKRRRNFQRRIEDFLIEEQIHRDEIVRRELTLSRDFFFGPLVHSEDDSSVTSR